MRETDCVRRSRLSRARDANCLVFVSRSSLAIIHTFTAPPHRVRHKPHVHMILLRFIILMNFMSKCHISSSCAVHYYYIAQMTDRVPRVNESALVLPKCQNSEVKSQTRQNFYESQRDCTHTSCDNKRPEFLPISFRQSRTRFARIQSL